MVLALSTGIYAGMGVAGAMGLAAGGCAYAAMWPGSRIFGTALVAPARPGELALTFDDGPSADWTPRLLDVLGKNDVRATFFVLGGRAQAAPRLVRQMKAEGHLIGNHSWSHPNMALAPARRVRQELARTNDVLEQILGERIEFFRPPFGARRPAVFDIARELGLRPVLWNAMTSDWKTGSAERIAAELTAKIDGLGRSGRAANIVLHDGGHQDAGANREASVDAAGRLAARYKETHKFVTLDGWSG